MESAAKRSKKGTDWSRYVYGNYDGYYAYRYDVHDQEDPRVKVLQAEWFQGKDCLDIGSNNGIFTLTIASKFHCRSILGLEIDRMLVEKARKNVKIARGEYVKVTGQPKSAAATIQPVADAVNETEFPNNCMFMVDNYLEDPFPCADMSLTKWIHYNWGDDGIMRLFHKVFQSLKSGGKFILEPQNWQSYQKKKFLTPHITETVLSIRLRPDRFTDYLLKNVGFASVEKFNVTDAVSKGFQRPIFVFTK